MSKLPRRDFLRGAGAATVAALSGCDTGAAMEAARSASPRSLIRDPSGTLELPRGFTLRVLQRAGARMSDGYVVPARPDAMACFLGPDGHWILMRNHENAPGQDRYSAFAGGRPRPAAAYDADSNGGVTRVVIDPSTLNVVSSNLVLAGTSLNCAGGTSPWGFLTCEETDEPRHGYVFLCRTDAATVQPPQRIVGYGRMRHEAALVDPSTHVAYLTEDRLDGCFYRFVPNDPSKPFEGKLQALRARGQQRVYTHELPQGAAFDVDWVDIEHPDSEDVRVQGHALGAARFARGEGMWLSGRDVFFCATIGGSLGRGQIFRLRIDTQRMEVVAEATRQNGLDMPDNITVSSQGHIYVCEDGRDGNAMRRLTLDGGCVEFARNVRSASELAGACFSPDGRVLFVNLQDDGLTLAIEGPFGDELAYDAPSPRSISSGLALLAMTAFARSRRR